jgi:hypothetical protein
MLKNFGYDFEALRCFLSQQKTRQSLKRPKFVSSNWSPEWGALILGRARAVIGDLMATSRALTGHTDSVIIRKGSRVQCPSLGLIRSLGSDLVHEKQYDGDMFWICRSAVYTTLRNGEALKPTHHGYPVDRHRDFGDIIEHNLENPRSLISKCSKTHLVTPKESLRTGKPLGAQEIRNYNINWVWDGKRVLDGNDDELWTGWANTRPWSSIETLLETTLPKKTRKTRALNPDQVEKIQRLRAEGLSAARVAALTGFSPGTVYKYSLH